MKRRAWFVSAGVVMLTGLSSAQTEGLGAYIGGPEWMGAQYQFSIVRVSAGLAHLGLGAGIDALIGEYPLNLAPDLNLSWYFGAGASAALWNYAFNRRMASGGMHVFPHVLAGVECEIPSSPVNVFCELQLGPDFISGYVKAPPVGVRRYADVDLGRAARIGVIWRK